MSVVLLDTIGTSRGYNTFLSSPHLRFNIYLIRDLFGLCNHPLKSKETFMRTKCFEPLHRQIQGGFGP